MKNLASIYFVLLLCLLSGVSKSQMTFTLPAMACQNSTLMVSVNSSSSSLSYTWSSSPIGAIFSAPNASSSVLSFSTYGTFTITLLASTSSGTLSNTKVISIEPFPIQALSALSSTICAPTSASLSVTGANGYTWSPAAGLSNINGAMTLASPSVSTVYTVTGNSTNCGTSSISFNVFVGVFPFLSFSSSANALCPEETAVLNGFGALAYTWLGSTFSVSVSQPSITVTAGNYTLIGSNGGSCTNTLSPIIIGLKTCTGIEETKANEKNFILFPNPVKEILFIQSKTNNSSRIELQDVLGKVIYSNNIVFNDSETKEIDLSGLPSGLYYLKLSAEDGSSQIRKFLKE